MNAPQIKQTYGENVLVIDYRNKLKCLKCGSKKVHIILISNMGMPKLDLSREVYYSDDILGAYQIKNEPCILPYSNTVLH